MPGDPSSAGDLGALDPAAIARVRAEAMPDPRDADELHDALLVAGCLTDAEVESAGADAMERLVSAGRACRISVMPGAPGHRRVAIAAERIPELLAVHPGASLTPPIDAPPSRSSRVWTRDEAIVELLRGRLTIAGPTTAEALAGVLGIAARDADAALLALEAEGVVLRGRFSPRQAGLKASATNPADPGRIASPESPPPRDRASARAPARPRQSLSLVAPARQATAGESRVPVAKPAQAAKPPSNGATARCWRAFTVTR